MPRVPRGVKLWKKLLRPVGLIAIGAAILGSIAHYLTYGPKEPREPGGEAKS